MRHKQWMLQVHMRLEHILSAGSGMEQPAPLNSLIHTNQLAHRSPSLGFYKHLGATADPSIVPQKQD